MERQIKTAYTRTRQQTAQPAERKTKCVQSEKHASNINNIVAKANKTGMLPVLMQRQPIQNLPTETTYQEALDKVVHANQQFERLPAAIRNEFDNDPRKLLAALDKPEDNLNKLLKAAVLEPVKEVIDPIIAELRKMNAPAEPSPNPAPPTS